jgi:hypothetical protein
MASNILNKAKPKVAPPPPKEEEPPAAAASSPGKEPTADKMEETAASPTVNGEQQAAAADTAVPAEMDVDWALRGVYIDNSNKFSGAVFFIYFIFFGR